MTAPKRDRAAWVGIVLLALAILLFLALARCRPGTFAGFGPVL